MTLTSIFGRLLRFVRRFRLVPRPYRKHGWRDAMPFAMVLPILAYAYFSQQITAAETLRSESIARSQHVNSLGNRLQSAARTSLRTCRDYSVWSEMYTAIDRRDREWMRINLDEGLGATFGFDVAAVQSLGGEIVWSKGLNDSIAADMKRYGILRSAARRKDIAGLVVLDGRTYVCASSSVTDNSGTKSPNAAAFVAARIDRELLADLNAGVPHTLSYCEKNGQVASMGTLALRHDLPDGVRRILLTKQMPRRAQVEIGTDERTSFGSLPIRDVRGRTIGAIVDVTSRTTLLASMRTARLTSIILMVFCLVFGMAGTAYLRTRDLALRANRDELTGLYSHGYMQEFLKLELARSSRYDRPVSVLMLDIDHFKFVNDTYGHAVGDQVLRAIAQAVAESFRATDVIARYGGEELVIILPQTEGERARQSAERLCKSLQTRSFPAWSIKDHGGNPIGVDLTVSIGVATCPFDGSTPKQLIEAADVALAAAKQARNSVVIYSEIVGDDTREKMAFAVAEGFLRDTSTSTVRPLVAAIDTRDPGAAHHSEKVAEYAVAIGRELGFTTQDLSTTCKAALVHDVGKIGIPDSILTKNGRLTPQEMDVIRRHSGIGAEIVAKSPHLAPVAEIVLRHHERYDGTGYPDGISGDAIPMISRVIAVADMMDAMTSPRSYHEAAGPQQALSELQRQAGKQFDPSVVEAASRVIGRILRLRQAA